MNNRIILVIFGLLFFVVYTLPAEAEEPISYFSHFNTVSYNDSDDGVFISAEFNGAEITVSSFDSIDSQRLQKLEKYIVDALFNSVSADNYSVKISSIEILLSGDVSVLDVKIDEYLLEINDILAVRAGDLFQNRFTATFTAKSPDVPQVVFADMIYDCGLFYQNDEEPYRSTGFPGWKEISRQIMEWVQTGYEGYKNPDVLSFVYNSRVMIDADSPEKWSDVFILPPEYAPESVSGLMLEISGANLFKDYGDRMTAGFGSLTLDLLYITQPRRRPDLSNFRVFDAGYSFGLFFEWDPVLERNEGPIDEFGAGISAAANILLYMPEMRDSLINDDAFAVGAELLIRANLIPFFDGSDFYNDNDFLLHISPRMLVRIPFAAVFGTDIAIGFPSVRLVPGGENIFVSLLTIGVDVGVRAYYLFD